MLGGALSPIDGVDPEDLKIAELVTRVDGASEPVSEVVLATNPTTTGEATAHYVAELLRGRVTITRLASGLPVGADLEHADEVTLGRALAGRLSRRRLSRALSTSSRRRRSTRSCSTSCPRTVPAEPPTVTACQVKLLPPNWSETPSPVGRSGAAVLGERVERRAVEGHLHGSVGALDRADLPGDVRPRPWAWPRRWR